MRKRSVDRELTEESRSAASPQDKKFMRVEEATPTPGEAIEPKGVGDVDMINIQSPEGIYEGCPGEPSGRGTGRGDAIPSMRISHAARDSDHRAHVLQGSDFVAALEAARAMDEARWSKDDPVISYTIGGYGEVDRVNGQDDRHGDPLHQADINADMLRRSLRDEDAEEEESEAEDE